MKGMRVQSIIRELRGEKIDIIEWNEDPVAFATNALSPAKVSRVTVVDPAARHLEVVVEDSQLSLAIGRKGQNVRLASKLLDWHIDIKSEEEKRQEVEAQMAGMMPEGVRAPLSELAGIGAKTKEKLLAQGISTVEELAGMTPEQLTAIPGIGEKMVQKIAAAVKQHFEPEVTAPVAAEAVATAEEATLSSAGVAEEAEGEPASPETPATESEKEQQTAEAEVAEQTADLNPQKVE